jgi:hypothetical protein
MSEKRYPVSGGLRRMVGLGDLESRVARLEAELDDYRRAHLRFAELVDLVQELLLPVAQRDEEKVARLVAQYTDELEA